MKARCLDDGSYKGKGEELSSGDMFLVSATESVELPFSVRKHEGRVFVGEHIESEDSWTSWYIPNDLKRQYTDHVMISFLECTV